MGKNNLWVSMSSSKRFSPAWSSGNPPNNENADTQPRQNKQWVSTFSTMRRDDPSPPHDVICGRD